MADDQPDGGDTAADGAASLRENPDDGETSAVASQFDVDGAVLDE